MQSYWSALQFAPTNLPVFYRGKTYGTTWILDYNYGWIPDPISWIPDSKAVDSGFHRPKLPGFRIPDYLTWGEIMVRFPPQEDSEVKARNVNFVIFSW